MDPIHPVSPRPPAVLPVSESRVKRVVRDPRKQSRDAPKDRFTQEQEHSSADHPGERARREPSQPPPPGGPPQVGEDEHGPRHIDVRA